MTPHCSFFLVPPPLLLPSLFLCHMPMQGENGSLAPHGGGAAPHTSPLTEIWSVCALIRNNQTSWLERFVYELLCLSAACCCVVIPLIIGLFIPNSFFNLLSLLIRLVIPSSFFIEINPRCQVYLSAIHRVITLLSLWKFASQGSKTWMFWHEKQEENILPVQGTALHNQKQSKLYIIYLYRVQQIKCFATDKLIILFVWLWVTIICLYKNSIGNL